MATCTTATWGNSYSPKVTLTVTQSSSTNTNVTLTYTLQYIAQSGYPAYTNGTGRSYSIVIDGKTVKSGTYNINGVTGTKTIVTDTITINKGTSARNISFSCSFSFNVTWDGTYGGTKSASGSISIAAKPSYTITYDANTGTGAPAAQTKWYGTNITLSTVKPTKSGHTFGGWSTGSTTYQPGATYSANASVTLYAVWTANYKKPRISNFSVTRCDSLGNITDSGTYMKVAFNWATDKTVSYVRAYYKGSGATSYSYTTITASGTSGTVNEKLVTYCDLDKSYSVYIEVADASYSSKSNTLTLASQVYPIDIYKDGTGVSFGKTAETSNLLESQFPAKFNGAVTAGGTLSVTGATTLNGTATLNGSTSVNNNLFVNSYAAIYYYRFAGGWIGFYSSHANAKNNASRQGYIGHSGSSNLILANEVSGGQLRFSIANGDNVIFIPNTDTTSAITSFVRPNVANKIGLGHTSYRWYCLYQYLSAINTSDEREKHDITAISDLPNVLSSDGGNFLEILFSRLVPKVYCMNEDGERLHIGFVAQDIAKVLDELGVGENDLGLLQHDYWIDEETGEEKDLYGLGYSEFIALNTHMIQKQQKRINTLENEVAELKSLVQQLLNKESEDIS